VCPTSTSAAHSASSELVAAIAEAGAGAARLRDFRARALALIAPHVPFDAAIYHALSPRVPLETGVLIGLSPQRVTASMAHWDRLAVELEALRSHAIAHGGVAGDRDAFPLRSRSRKRFDAGVTVPLGMRSLAIAHLALHERIFAAVLLLRRRAAPFTSGELDLLRALVPVLSLADAALAGVAGETTASVPIRLRCLDQRLTIRQREIVEHVALGHTNAETASALGLSANTLRNHLVAIFRRLGASNRADVVRLAVLR
jgi:DNA-binding CsgD family transcriptional regulator